MIPEAKGAKMQTILYKPIDCISRMQIAVMSMAWRLSRSFLSTVPSTYIQMNRPKQFGSQNKKLYIYEPQAVATPAFIAQVEIQLPMPNSSVEQKKKIRHAQMTDLLLKLGPFFSFFQPFSSKLGKGLVISMAKVTMLANPSALNVYSLNTATMKGPHMAPTPKTKPISCTQYSGLSPLKILKTTAKEMTTMPTRAVAVMKIVMTRFDVVSESEAMQRLTIMMRIKTKVKVCVLTLVSSYLTRKPPITLAAERTMNRQEYSVSSRPVAQLKWGMRGPKQEMKHPLRKEMKTSPAYCQYLPEDAYISVRYNQYKRIGSTDYQIFRRVY